MLTLATHECPHCGGAINREHFVEYREDDCLVTMLYCEWCDIGREAIWERVERDVLRLEFFLEYHAATEPKALADFLQRLHDRIAA